MIRKIERDGGTRWQVYGRHNGKKVYVGTYTNEEEAKSVEAEADHRPERLRQLPSGAWQIRWFGSDGRRMSATYATADNGKVPA